MKQDIFVCNISAGNLWGQFSINSETKIPKKSLGFFKTLITCNTQYSIDSVEKIINL